MPEQIVEQLSLVYQPIMTVLSEEDSEVYAYETLLRSKETNRFPKDEFNQLIESDETNQVLMNWFKKELTSSLSSHPEKKFGLNVHPQQLQYPSTWAFLEAMKPFNGQLRIELTEYPPFFHRAEEWEAYDLRTHIEKIAQWGYGIVIDDIGAGQNTLELVAENIDSISCFKFSLIAFRALDWNTLLKFLEAWLQLANQYHIMFIVEGVEDQEIMRSLYRKNITLQQGDYWSAGEKLGR